MQAQLDRIEAKLDAILARDKGRKQAATERKKQYRQKKLIRERGRFPLPENGVLKTRDVRLRAKQPEWARRMLEFGKQGKLEEFLRWFVWDYNCCTYLKKPITFSGGYFRVDIGGVRSPYSEFELMGLTKHRLKMRHAADADDFSKRPWWSWSYLVLQPVYQLMREMPGFDEVHERFDEGLLLLQGSYSVTPVEVYTELYWDQNESLKTLNKMLKKTGPLLHECWRACAHGLRTKTDPSVTD